MIAAASKVEDLFKKHEPYVKNFILSKVSDRDIANDILQDSFMKVIQAQNNGTYTEQGKFLSWVMQIARNKMMDHFRKTSRVAEVGTHTNTNYIEYFTDSTLNAEDALIKEQTLDNVRELVKTLPENQKEVLIMRFYRDMSFKEISKETNVSIGTALGRMRYAIVNIRKMMMQNNLTLLN